MRRFFTVFLVATILFSMIAIFAGCSDDTSAPPANHSIGEFADKLVAEKVGTIKLDNFSTCEGGIYYKGGNGKYGVMSNEGKYDTGAVYSFCASKGIYFAVSKSLASSYNDIAGLNSVGLINGKGKTVAPMIYASFKILNERYIQAFQVTERTFSKDDALVYFSDDSFSFSPDEDDILYKGKWFIYDVTTGKLVNGVSGTKDTTVVAYGNNIVYYNDNNERIIVDGSGVALPESAKLFNNGSYSITEKDGIVYDTNGKKMFTYDLTDFCPTSFESNYYVASKSVDGETKYVVLDKTGKKISAEFDSSISLYGELIYTEDKIYNHKGENIVKGTYKSVTLDETFKDCYMLYQDDVYTIIKEDGTVLFNAKNNDNITIHTSEFVVSKKADYCYLYYSHKDKDYTINGYSFAPWLIKTNGANSLYNVVDTISGEVLFEGYSGYSHSKAGGKALYVYAKHGGGADVYLITPESQLAEVAAKKNNLYDDLIAAFKKEGISVTVDKETGEIAMNSSVLFGGDSAELTSAGKDFLDKFIRAYTSIAFSDKYNGFISKTMIEGHTAPVSGATYADGINLSINRATNVKNYCLSSKSVSDADALAESIEAVGYSNSKPVYNTDGSINMDACRRVSFRFMVSIESIDL